MKTLGWPKAHTFQRGMGCPYCAYVFTDCDYDMFDDHLYVEHRAEYVNDLHASQLQTIRHAERLNRRLAKFAEPMPRQGDGG